MTIGLHRYLTVCYLLFQLGNVAARGVETNNSLSVKEIVNIIERSPKTKEEHVAKVGAIRLAVQIHTPTVELINALLDNMQYIPKIDQISLSNPMEAKKFDLFPARDALLEIGDPVIPILIQRIVSTENLSVRQNYTVLLNKYNYEKKRVALEKALSGAKTDNEKKLYIQLLN